MVVEKGEGSSKWIYYLPARIASPKSLWRKKLPPEIEGFFLNQSVKLKLFPINSIRNGSPKVTVFISVGASQEICKNQGAKSLVFSKLGAMGTW